MNFAEVLKKYRRSSGITQIELAKLLDTHQPIISNFESGRTVPTPQEIERIVEALKLNEAESAQLKGASIQQSASEPTPLVNERGISSSDLTKEFNTQILDLRNSINSISDRISTNGGDNGELASAISDMQSAIADLQKTSSDITAPVALPSKDELQVRLISTTNFDRLEEYRSGENKWFSFGCLFAGMLGGILVNIITGASISPNTWVVGGTFIVGSVLCFLSGYNYSKKATALTNKLTHQNNG
ncbi:hypothetical protein CKO50_23435 [Pseudoalteromonas sp. HM-SA03]|uniref:helix-turn-helix domain-containing protein n=1 Tax=Pseudoalteromonas sp. HM-SA03 TaxID=2029678 RepID=UPI000BAE12D6|nr:helix-turn-helix transcriptional regulator [Pseudoalteromonas sp. HM-SA03]PAX98978.1 hypothetical protein CKO50_23435 [Pseudoalteromonas sp. HM-SA03]